MYAEVISKERKEECLDHENVRPFSDTITKLTAARRVADKYSTVFICEDDRPQHILVTIDGHVD